MTARPDPTDAELAALVAAAKARPDYQAALAREVDPHDYFGANQRAAAIVAIYRELLIAGGWLDEGDDAAR